MNNKLCFLTFISPLIFFSGSVFSAEVYKSESSYLNLEGLMQFNLTNRWNGDGQSSPEGAFDSRMGFRMGKVISDDLQISARAEYTIRSSDYAGYLGKNPFEPRYVYISVASDKYGTLSAGRVVSGMIMLTDMGDIFEASDVLNARQITAIDATATQVFRQDATLQYQNSFGNLDFSAAYIFGNSKSNVKDAYNIAMRYNFDLNGYGKLIPVVGYQTEKVDNQSLHDKDIGSGLKGTSYQYGGVGVRYVYEGLTVGISYNKDKLELMSGADSQDKLIESSLSYDLTQKVALKLGYRKMVNSGGDRANYNDTTFQINYDFADNIGVYGTYVLRNGDKGDQSIVADFNPMTGWNNPEENYYQLDFHYYF